MSLQGVRQLVLGFLPSRPVVLETSGGAAVQ